MARLKSEALVSIRGADAVALRFKLIGRRSSNVSPRVWKGIGAYLSREIYQQFVTDGARFGTPWEPLSAKWVKYKRKHGYSTRILRMTGEMRQSLVGRPMDVERYYKTTAVYGTRNKKAVWHQDGTRSPYGLGIHNPPRPIINLTEEVENEIADRLAKYIVGRK